MYGNREQNLLQILVEEAFLSSLLGNQGTQKRDKRRHWKKDSDERKLCKEKTKKWGESCPVRKRSSLCGS